MDYTTYKFIHLIGVLILLSALGGYLFVDVKKPAALRLPGIMHGISLLLILVSGVGMWHKGDLDLAGWMIAKFVIWFIMGGIIVLLKKRSLPTAANWAIVLILASASAWLAIFRPF